MTNLREAYRAAETTSRGAEVYPDRCRYRWHRGVRDPRHRCFAAAFGKIGAVATAFLFPILLVAIGTTPLLYILVATSLLGAVVTWKFRIETTGVNLEDI